MKVNGNGVSQPPGKPSQYARRRKVGGAWNDHAYRPKNSKCRGYGTHPGHDRVANPDVRHRLFLAKHRYRKFILGLSCGGAGWLWTKQKKIDRDSGVGWDFRVGPPWYRDSRCKPRLSPARSWSCHAALYPAHYSIHLFLCSHWH